MISAYIDRMEGRIAVLLLGDSMKKVNFPAEFLPADTGEGDYLKLEISYDKEATEQAEQEALNLLNE